MLGHLTQLQSLNLSRNQLTALPESLGKLRQLQTLNLFDTQLKDLPEWLGQLTQLLTLDLSLNQLTTLPESMGQLTQLRTLELCANSLSALPDSLGQLTQLRILRVDGNLLQTIPGSISELQSLEDLTLGSIDGGIPFGELPDSIRQLKRLKKLWAIDCHLKSLASWLGDLPLLRELHFAQNALVDLPKSLASLEELETLYLWGNPLVPELAAAEEEGIEAVKAFLLAKVKG